MTTEEQTTIDTLMELKQLLQTENEHLYQQYNHLMIRNQKLMKRIDDQQQLNDRLQGRIAALENIIDKMRLASFTANSASYNQSFQKSEAGGANDSLNPVVVPNVQGLQSNIHVRPESISSTDLTQLIARWGALAGDTVKNTPTKKRQMQILTLLYDHQKMSGLKLFMTCGITGVSGARYIHTLKQFGLIEFSGYRKGGHYLITEKGKKLVEGETVEP